MSTAIRQYFVRSIYCGYLMLLFAHPAGHAQAQATLQDYWNGNAKWEFERKWTSSDSSAIGNVASRIKVANGVWYLFQREFIGGSTPCKNPGLVQLGIRVYRSTDRGASWVGASEPSLAPTPGTDFSCQIADGDAIYDAASNKWRFLFQCLNDANVWQGCYAERQGADPMGAFDYASANRRSAVITSGSLWQSICNWKSTVCAGVNVRDEGTFDIFRYDGLYYWVSFHGYDGVRGYRGIAKTIDFVNWVAGDPAYDLPADAILSSRDAVYWHESWGSGGNIGPGNGSTVEENGYTYQLVEFADQNLACQNNQRWDLGLFRTNDISSTAWEQLPSGNPIVLSSRAIENGSVRACNVQYGQLFVDTTVSPSVVYMKYGRETSNSDFNGTYLYRLKYSRNILKNGNLLEGLNHWGRRPEGNVPNQTVYRFPNESPDGTQFMATNCGTWTSSCPPDSSVYQDLDASAYAGKNFTFGGQFSTDQGDGGAASLAIFQFDVSGNVTRGDGIPVNVNGRTYRNIGSTSLPMLATTRKVRFQFYHGTNAITYRMNNLYINIE